MSVSSFAFPWRPIKIVYAYLIFSLCIEFLLDFFILLIFDEMC
jgi:hypothetical protein